eukprot:scaffold2212_cov143-Cylindrotheca_fusiformis.AAC.6
MAFISLISWGANTMWPLGFILSALYTAFLFFLARYLEHNLSDTTTRNDSTATSSDGNVQQVNISTTNLDSISTFKKTSGLVSLLYGLGVISLGVTGFFLPVNFLDCTGAASSPEGFQFYWSTNKTDLPPSVRKWASDTTNEWNPDGPSFAYVPSTGVTMFDGTDSDTTTSKLWTLKGPNPAPVKHLEYDYPSPFIPMSASAVCFQPDPMPSASRKGETEDLASWIFCSDGIEFKKEQVDRSNSDAPKAHYDTLLSFYPVNGTLWFKELPSNGMEDGTMVYSLDLETMISTLHSKRVPASKERDCDENAMIRKVALLSLLVSVIPMTALSIILWKTKRVPSMGVLCYICITLVYISIHAAIAPEDLDGEFIAFRWWCTVSGLLCLVVSAHLLLSIDGEISIDSSHAGPLRGSLVASALAFTWGTSMLFFFDDFNNRDTLGWWILWNISTACPLILIGVATNSVSVLWLGGQAFISDAFRLAEMVDSTLFFFLVFSLIGLSIGSLGYFFMWRYQEAIQSWSRAQVQVINGYIVATCHPSTRYQELATTLDEVDSSSLLPQEEPSSEEA